MYGIYLLPSLLLDIYNNVMHILSVFLMVSPDEYQCGISRQILSYFLRISYVFTCVRMHYRENTEHMLVFDINFDNFYIFLKLRR